MIAKERERELKKTWWGKWLLYIPYKPLYIKNSTKKSSDNKPHQKGPKIEEKIKAENTQGPWRAGLRQPRQDRREGGYLVSKMGRPSVGVHGNGHHVGKLLYCALVRLLLPPQRSDTAPAGPEQDSEQSIGGCWRCPGLQTLWNPVCCQGKAKKIAFYQGFTKNNYIKKHVGLLGPQWVPGVDRHQAPSGIPKLKSPV